MALAALILPGAWRQEVKDSRWAGAIPCRVGLQHRDVTFDFPVCFPGHRMDAHRLLQQRHHLRPDRKRECWARLSPSPGDTIPSLRAVCLPSGLSLSLPFLGRFSPGTAESIGSAPALGVARGS